MADHQVCGDVVSGFVTLGLRCCGGLGGVCRYWTTAWNTDSFLGFFDAPFSFVLSTVKSNHTSSEARVTPVRLPKVIIIGAAKSATTSFFHRLITNPKVYGGKEDTHPGAVITHNRDKEPCFFSDDENYAKGIGWYADIFKGARPDQICIDASTNYTRWPQLPHTAERLAKHIPNARLIYICRHPVDRAYSHYVHRNRLEYHEAKQFQLPFEEHVKQDPMCIDSSLYMKQIERFLEHFPRESLQVILTSDIKNDLENTIARTCRFIGIPPHDSSQFQLSEIGRNEARFYHDGQTRSAITSRMTRIPIIGSMARKLPQSWKNMIYATIKQAGYTRKVAASLEAPPLTKEVRERYLKFFEEPNAALSQFLGRDLSEWSL